MERKGVARTAFAADTYNEAFRRLASHPRLIDPVSQILDGDVYTTPKLKVRLRLTELCGNGIKIMELEKEMTGCQNQEL